jgi:peptidoglycan hydrolase-like protein with peptidoglycan-binding domain
MTLWLNTRGEEVHSLQEQLGRVGYPVPEAEVGEAVFGAGTLAAVRELQRLAGLEPTGVFDSDAEAALTRAQAEAAYDRPRVEGRLQTDLGTPAAAVALRLYRHRADGEVQPLAEATTDGDGFYRLDYDCLPPRRSTG